MFKKQMFQHFISGFLSVFRFGSVPFEQEKILDIAEYFCQVEKDLDKSYQELKNHERN